MASGLSHAARRAERRATLHAELMQIYEADQADRAASAGEPIDGSEIELRDRARRERVSEILASGGARASDDYFHAAMVFQHGESPDDIQRAHDLALRAVALDPENREARWLAAASEDRKLVDENKPQKWGTQYQRIDGRWALAPVDPTITDEQRAEWEVPPLAEAKAREAEMNAK